LHTLITLTVVISSISQEPTAASRNAPRYESVSTLASLSVLPSTERPTLRAPGFHVPGPVSTEEGNDEELNRIFLEFLAGSGGGILGWELSRLALGSDLKPPASLVIPMSTLVLGSGVGAGLVGITMDGRGGFGYALLGSVIGSSAPLIAGIAMLQFGGCGDNLTQSCYSMLAKSLIGLLVMPAVGAIVGYELSMPKSWLLLNRAPWGLAALRYVVPVLAPARQGLGATVGLAGTL
jgi:hypothetical protein